MKAKLHLLIVTLCGTGSEAGLGQPIIQFTANTYTVVENEASVRLGVWRLNDTSGAVTVDYATTNGTATADLDYTAANGSLTFLAGETSKTITVPILNDGRAEGAETFTVTLSKQTGGAVLGAPATATVQITDNDVGLQFEFGTSTFGSYRVGENESFILLAVMRGDDGNFPVSVNFATSNGSATSGVDYVATNGTLSFAAGERLQTFMVAILNDGLKEANETFLVTLSNPTNQVLASQNTSTVTIADNDPGVQFQPYNLYRVAENAGALTLTVARGNDGNLGPITVDYVTGNLSATAGLDFASGNGTLNFAQGEMFRTLIIPILYDEVREADEQFKVTLSSPTGGAVLGSNAVATVVILDITNTPPHRFDRVAAQPDRSIQLTLGGSVDGHFKDYFDLYPMEVSSNLLDWTPLVTLLRTNAATNALTYPDTQATNLGQGFYRTATNHLITPWVKPTGPFPVGVVHRLLTDPTRRNRYWVSTNCAFMVSVWYPATAEAGRLPGPFTELQIAQDPTWMPAFGLADFTARMPSLLSQAVSNAPCAILQAPYPVVLSSPGRGAPRMISSVALGPELASHGFVMVAVDHYDAIRTALPDGTYLQGDLALSVAGNLDRVQDLLFILDELERWNTNDPLFAGRLDLTKVASMGGSRGAVTAAQYAWRDNRCQAVIGLDPGAFGAAPEVQQIAQPALEICRANNFGPDLYDRTTNHAVWFQISGTDHLMIAGNDLAWAWNADVAAAREVARTLHAYVRWFLKKYLKGSTEPMPALAAYPRVVNFKQK